AARIDEMLSLVGLSERAGSKARTYSLGMRQRLAIASALLTDPDLVVMGETIFVSSHLLGEVEQMCDHVAILKSGRLLMQGEVKALVGQGTALEMQVTDMDRALEVLAGLDFVKGVKRDGVRLVVETTGERAADVSRALAENEIYLSELRTRQD